MEPCPHCGSTERTPYLTKPPKSHPGRPCDRDCYRAGLLCLKCRIFR